MVDICAARIIAMAIDCEGTIGISDIGGHRCTIGNTELILLQYLQQLADGAGKITGPYETGYKPTYTWRLGVDDMQIINAMEPYLILKRRQAQLLIAMRSAVARGELVNYKRCAEVMRKLNGDSKRGRPRKVESLPIALPDDEI